MRTRSRPATAVLLATGALLQMPLSAGAASHPYGHRHSSLHHRRSVATYAARHPRAGYVYGSPNLVYGASAPYYVFGPGGGDAYGYDPIGGPEHVGDGGPAGNF